MPLYLCKDCNFSTILKILHRLIFNGHMISAQSKIFVNFALKWINYGHQFFQHAENYPQI